MNNIASLNAPRENSLKQIKTYEKIRKCFTVVLRAVFLVSISYILLYPLFFMFSASLKSSADILDPTVVWIPKALTTFSFTESFKALDYVKTFTNTITLEVVSALIEVASCAVAAYGLSRFDFFEKKILYILMILTILVPAPMLVIPTSVNFQHLDLLGILGLIGKITGTELRPNILGTPLTFYIPSLLAVGLRSGLFIFIYCQFFKGLPKELEEAAWIDGATPARTFISIIVPSSSVAIFTITIFSIVWHWNDYYMAFMYASESPTLSTALSNIGNTLNMSGIGHASAAGVGITSAACLVTIAPILLMYLILQRKFITSIDRVGIVG